ncbi:acyl-CoA dehydrogenase family protein [Nocardioides marinisabuli]|uniref:acyl-CoA dehydrogenase family protein n=1 Tax=Nocardioides marinisabuli TaxID=419476 RepID=UPI001C60E3F3|nr:acyl-CoA dehydrogenase family protein [Nocardioides marinisabuli]
MLCEQVGVAALAVPEEHDGAGASAFETCVVLEELGRCLAPSPLLASLVVAETLLASGPPRPAPGCCRGSPPARWPRSPGPG